MRKQTNWQWKIDARTPWFRWKLGELPEYRDLLWSFVRRDLIASYQQTVLGPFWVFLQPVLTTLVYWLIFGKIAKLSTDNIPPILFYLPGIIIWSYFSDCLNGTMYTFLQNASVFSKVYFPRLIVPLSNIVTHSVRMGIQLLLFVIIYIFYLVASGTIHPTIYILLVPLLVLQVAAFSLGAGLIICVITARYRDLDYALQFILRLYMFATPIVYPASIVPAQYTTFYWLNPLTPAIETFRAACFGTGSFHFGYLLISMLVITVLLVTGLSLFKRRELQVMDII